MITSLAELEKAWLEEGCVEREGFQLLECRKGFARAIWKPSIEGCVRSASGKPVLQGGYFSVFTDMVGVLAARTVEEDYRHVMLFSGSFDLVRPIFPGAEVVCEASVRTATRTSILVYAEILDAEDRLISRHHFCFHRKRV